MVILCTIDLETREVSLPAGQVIASYDHNVDVIRFQAEAIPGFSLDTSSIKIAAQGPNKARHDYPVDPSTVQIEEETGYITFDWPIPQGVTEMPIGSGFKYGDKGQLIFAVCAEIISGNTVSKAWHSDDGIITVVAHLEPESGGGEDPSEEATNAQKIGQLQTTTAILQREVSGIASGTPPTAATIAEMDAETSTVYIYTGSESGESTGYWYYYNGTTFVPGGQYGGAVTSTTFNKHGVPADDFAVGEAFAEKADSDDVTALGTRVTAVEGDLTQLQLGNLPKTIIKNSYVTVTGEIIAYNGWDRTEYIPVNKYYSIVAKSSVSSAYNAFFDENFDKIGSNFTVGTTDTTVLVPTGAKYVVFSNTAAGMQNLETHYVTKTENTATGVKNAYFLDQEGKLPYYIVNNERITNLGVVETKPGWDRTEYIPVSKYKKLVAKSSASSPYNVFYAEDKVTKVGNAITVGTTDTEISIPSGAHYIIFSNTAAGMQDFECVYTLKNIYMNDINQGLAVVMPPIDETINYNTDTKTLSIPSGTSVYFGTNLRNVTATDLSITVSNRVRINYDYVNDTFSATAFNVPTPENNVLFAILRRDTYGKKVSMAINAPYTIDGVPYGVKPPSERYVPEYYKTYIQGKAVEINELESGLNGDSFIFLTDYHRQSNKKNSPSLVKYLMENTGARFVMFGGDAQDYEETLDDAVKETMGFKEDFASERDCLFCAIGNHEFNYHYHNLDPEQYPASIKMTYNQIYSLLLKQNEHLFGALNSYGDYWFDNAVQKIRYFVIGCDEGSGISSIQFVWFLEQLLLVPNGYTVFVFSHATFKQKGDIIAGRTHIYVYDYVEKMANALEALGNSQAYTFNNVVYDFSNKDVTRGIIIGGHTHFDANTQDYEYLVNYSDQSISWDITPIICVTTDAISRYRTDTEIITRTAGTTSEQAFDYVRIDKTNKTVTFKRIGAGSDRVISY